MRRTLFLGLTLLTAMAAFAMFAGATSAKDRTPCEQPGQNDHAYQYCSLWRGHVPVLANPDPNSMQVGELVAGGDANWFYCQKTVPGATYHYGGYYNNNYAYTVADNGEVGWVPEVFFSGGGNNDYDAGLVFC